MAATRRSVFRSEEDSMWRKPAEGKPSSESYNQPVASAAPNEYSPAPQALAAPPAPSRSSAESAPVALGNNASKITSGLKINGEISGSADLFIDGELQGKLRLANARVTVGPNGRVQADIEAREIVVEGKVDGNLKASERAHFGSSSRVNGSVMTPRIGIDDGARLRGKVETVPTAPVRPTSSGIKQEATETLQPVEASVKGE
ncbi:MAG: polymer-forming cytoskeletal protein [Candidatus Acidiferrales bacterium]